ncbi:hypothetical protein [Streptomyces diastatochromogenes]|uniref:DUF7848 domain-containing protein n=1 Tax=Streptomyces diastatochromogenes TaxID=42236 RepID=A0A233SSW2_STRDA|nr:hypothetical protein [Streptomyces diastatochromogenes]MCZ0987621.1 hypothetical protein [Streptomyces diastatochromogenes]OXY98731.1 hypothetical protein BEK98_07805 [Streptomyces diastatochromogenes]
MSTRALVCHPEWTLQPYREPDAEPTTYAMQCAVCGAGSPPSVDFADPQNWVFEHDGRNPSHHTYRAARRQPHIRQGITRPWRAWWKP